MQFDVLDGVVWMRKQPSKERFDLARDDGTMILRNDSRSEFLLHHTSVCEEAFPVGHQGEMPTPIHPVVRGGYERGPRNGSQADAQLLEHREARSVRIY